MRRSRGFLKPSAVSGPEAPLVFDIGAFDGGDTAYYLSRGCRVVAVDADLRMVEGVRKRFPVQSDRGQLTVVNRAVSQVAGQRVTFHLSRVGWWSSLNQGVAAREGKRDRTVEVETTTLAQLIERHGLPHYCKIDIEGADAAALRSLTGASTTPKYISVESECLTGDEDPSASDPLETLDALRDLGYTRFKLVEQQSLSVLEPGRRFYPGSGAAGVRTQSRIRNKLARWRLGLRHRHRFRFGASGPYGPDLASEWLGYEQGAHTLIRHRSDYFATAQAVPFGFWCDWHAARS